MREGSLQAPVRHPLNWEEPDFLDEKKLDEEMRRVFDICHGCRRCFNLCDSFPRLFDLVDNSPTEEMDGVKSEDFGQVVDACTLCDMCFMTKCPYVPPHEFNLDFPHLMLRYRAAEAAKGKTHFVARQLAEMDRNGTVAAVVAPVANWGSDVKNKTTRKLAESVAGIDARAELPKFNTRTFVMQDRGDPGFANEAAPAFGKRKALLFATCFVNYNRPITGMAARKLLNHLGVEAIVEYPGCCGMPFLEQANLERVAAQAEKVSAALVPYIDKGYDIITLTASCGLMFKFEWPLIVPKNENVARLAKATFDIDEYVVDIAKKDGLPAGAKPVDGGVSVHLACHARAQNMGPKAAEMLRLLPETKVDVIERCSGHGGTFGVLQPTHDLAVKVGRPAARTAAGQGHAHVVSDCPLAAKHLKQIMRAQDESKVVSDTAHPIELMAKAYGLVE
ncbi:MAG: glycerol-3-phosphate dehydrogenase [Alphaproteobacteria bacterium]|nr:glycerol-3-phosphate dehydrogenase [Alphaproteobacteria bacterium]